jgi:hypothetical protein
MDHPTGASVQSEAASLRPESGGRGFLVIDNFYEDPDAVRALALSQHYTEEPAAYTGWRSTARLLTEPMLARFRTWLGARALDAGNRHSGSFQCATGSHRICIHADPCSFAGLVYLTPHAPSGAGTSFFRHRASGATHGPTPEDALRRHTSLEVLRHELFRLNTYDSGDTAVDEVWDRVDRVGNVYNRLVLWDGMRLHAASAYFGDSLETGRLVQVFFFTAG